MEDMHTYAPRDSHIRSDIKLPLRYLSDDGECAIDVGYNGPHQTPSVDETSDAVLEYNVGRLMSLCVEKQGVGASVSQFGKRFARPSSLRSFESPSTFSTDVKGWKMTGLTPIGKYASNLGVVIRKTEPRVDCEPLSPILPPRLDLCQEALDDMPTWTKTKTIDLPMQFVGMECKFFSRAVF